MFFLETPPLLLVKRQFGRRHFFSVFIVLCEIQSSVATLGALLVPYPSNPDLVPPSSCLLCSVKQGRPAYGLVSIDYIKAVGHYWSIAGLLH